MKNVIVVIGAGQIGQAIARRVGVGTGTCSRCPRRGVLALPTRWGLSAPLLMGSDGGFITGSDFLMDGGVTAAYWYGELAP